MSGVEEARERVAAWLPIAERMANGFDSLSAVQDKSAPSGWWTLLASDLRLLLAEPVPEVTCPACGATIRARLADQPTTESVASSSTVVGPGGQP